MTTQKLTPIIRWAVRLLHSLFLIHHLILEHGSCMRAHFSYFLISLCHVSRFRSHYYTWSDRYRVWPTNHALSCSRIYLELNQTGSKLNMLHASTGYQFDVLQIKISKKTRQTHSKKAEKEERVWTVHSIPSPQVATIWRFKIGARRTGLWRLELFAEVRLWRQYPLVEEIIYIDMFKSCTLRHLWFRTLDVSISCLCLNLVLSINSPNATTLHSHCIWEGVLRL